MEDAGVWAHWNHPFAVHLSHRRPVSCSFPSCVPSGCADGGGCSGRGLGSGQPSCLHPELPQGVDGLMAANPLFAIWRQQFSFTRWWQNWLCMVSPRVGPQRQYSFCLALSLGTWALGIHDWSPGATCWGRKATQREGGMRSPRHSIPSSSCINWPRAWEELRNVLGTVPVVSGWNSSGLRDSGSGF